MIEKIVLDYLNKELEVPAYMEEPEDLQAEQYVLIEKTGSSQANHLYTVTLAIQSYAGTLYKAAQLNEQVKTAMDGITKEKEVTRSELNSDYNYTDTARKQYRYQAVYDLTHY